MFNTVYRLISPRQFGVAFEDKNMNNGDNVLVRPKYLSICNADQRYYQGLRPLEVMKKKLPMALIHEGIGQVVSDGTGTFKNGDMVVMIPNKPDRNDEVIGGNYLRSSKFAASSIDGFMQETVMLSPDRLIYIPREYPFEIMSFTEFVSVAVHAVKRFEKKAHERKRYIGIWGDGNLGFVTALVIRYMYPQSKVCVVGVNSSKLEKFTFADEIYLTTDIPDRFEIDHGFECVGGNSSHMAINQMIDYINPEGTISAMGVSEYAVPINTRMILEKGITLYGSSRSEREDFLGVLELYKKRPEMLSYLSNIVNREIVVRSLEDMVTAFEEDIRKESGKTIMKWEV